MASSTSSFWMRRRTDVKFEAGMHLWDAEGLSALRCRHCRAVRLAPGEYYSVNGDRMHGYPLCVVVPDIAALVARVSDIDAWRVDEGGGLL